ncbi:GH32 C-terminal domain-containing protein [Gramella sp. YB25]|uniref:GH32 C-terminal domain-containing protein n=2 Tax=Christiangramia crocea TaxID=2904124 RepID=A0A9X1UXX6_9FLAO|nr:GH32 C-terminal domain-containing protein [Gramella crocea]MCG9972190.1 GH32 C-terminal domain-containing protein [Gramella crocea]
MNNEFSFNLPVKNINKVEFVLSNKQNDSLKFGFNKTDHQFYVNRKKSGITDFSEKFTQKIATAPRIVKSDTLKVHFILDKTSIEIFYDDGATVMSEIFFPNKPYDTFTITTNSNFTIQDMEINKIDLE